jgi:ATP-dependent Clp protease protease subunit
MKTGKRAVRLLQAFAQASALGLALTFTGAGMAGASPAADTPPAPDSISTQTGAAANEDRTIRLSGEINTDNALAVIDRLRALSAADPRAEIVLRIDSPGGDVNQGLAIADAMASIPNDIRTVCEGEADSMAAFLLTQGTPGKREALPHCEIMLHQLSWSASGKVTDMAINTEWAQKQRALMDRMIAARSGWSQQFIHDLTERDLYLTADEAKQMGFIDRVLPPARHDRPPALRPVVPPHFCSEGRDHLRVCSPRSAPN